MACPYPLRTDEPWVNIWSWFHGALLRILLTDDAFHFCIFSCACNYFGMEMEECCQRWRITFFFFFFTRYFNPYSKFFISFYGTNFFYLNFYMEYAMQNLRLNFWKFENIENVTCRIYNYIFSLSILIKNNKFFPI